MIVIHDYRGHPIEVKAIAAGDRWNAGVRIRRTLSQEQTHVDVVACLKSGTARSRRQMLFKACGK